MLPVPHLQYVQLLPGGLPLIQHLQKDMRQVKTISLPNGLAPPNTFKMRILNIAPSTDGRAREDKA